MKAMTQPCLASRPSAGTTQKTQLVLDEVAEGISSICFKANACDHERTAFVSSSKWLPTFPSIDCAQSMVNVSRSLQQ